jgi:CheY-like chemotaxis protein
MELSAYNKPTQEPNASKNPARMLFIDDDEIQLIIMSAFIKQLESPVPYHTEMNGQKALDYLSELATEEFPELIVVDINMPVMDGFEFIRHYEQKFLPEHQNTQLFMLTSSIREEDRQRAMGFKSVQEFYSKPLTKDILISILEKSNCTESE